MQHKSSGTQYTRSQKRTSARTKVDKQDPPLIQANLGEIAAADFDKIASFTPLHQDSKCAIADVSSPTKHACTLEGADRNTSLAGHGIGVPRDKGPPVWTTTYFKQASINLKPITAVTIQRKPPTQAKHPLLIYKKMSPKRDKEHGK